MQYISRTKDNSPKIMNVEIPLDTLLDRHGRSFYWLAKETGVSYSTLWRLKKSKALGINFATLEKICAALDCTPGDVLKLGNRPEKTEESAKSATTA